MLPFDRLLRGLFVVHNRRFDLIAKQLRSYGICLQEDALENLYHQEFITLLADDDKIFFSGSEFHSVHPNVLKKIIVELDIVAYFNPRFDISRFDGITKNRLLQRHIEASFIGKLNPETIYQDIQETYGIEVPINIISEYRRLFIDLTCVRNQEEWFFYMRTLPRDEQIFRNAVITQPAEYVRWKLGCKVYVDPMVAMQQMSTDFFWLYKESLKDQTIQGLENTRRLAELAFKATDRVHKIGLSAKPINKAKNFNQLLLTFGDADRTTVDDLRIIPNNG
jgi:hypothetical protein